MADLGAALGLLVALIALSSAAIRRSPQALAATLAGIARAGLGTGLIVALTATGLSLADQVSAAVVSGSPQPSGRPSPTPGVGKASAASAPRRSRC